MFAGLERSHRPLEVELIRQRDVDGIDVRVGEQLLVPGIGARSAEFVRDCTSLALVARGEGEEGGARRFTHRGYHPLNRDRRGA